MSFNYLDGVPVKISEKFKPPPKVTIPQAIINRLNISENYLDSPQFIYDFTLETSVRSKVDQWRRVREIKRETRKERIRKYELNKTRTLEIKQKQLLTAVSYPNAEELSSDEEKETDKCTINECSNNHDSKEQECFQLSNGILKPSELWSDTILMPTVVPSDLKSCLITGIQNYPSTTKCSNSNINYSDFENIESSPFDNVELKTINELDVLAQVLNITQKHSNNKITIGKYDNCKSEFLNSDILKSEQITNEDEITMQTGTTELKTNNFSKHISAPNDTIEQFASGVSQKIENNHHVNSTIETNIPNVPINPEYPQKTGASQQQENTQQLFQNMNIEATKNATGFYYNYSNNVPTSSQNYYNFDYNYQRNQSILPQKQHVPPTSQSIVSQEQSYNQCNYTNNYLNNQAYLTSAHLSDFSSFNFNEVCDSQNKSKSVPDICKELNKEIRESEARRARNHSQTMEDHNVMNCEMADNVSSKKNKKTCGSKTFLKLSASSQTLAKNISSMGFPLELVSRIAAKYGNDDKKIIEHLIPLSELLDLGFDETKTSEALIKFDNNKEKALDFLISL